MREAAEAGYPTATDLADWIVRALKKPFREAHHIAGAIVRRAEELDLPLDKLPLAEMQTIEPGITAEVFCRAVARSIGQGAHELWRHRAGPRARAAALLEREAEMKLRIVLAIALALARRSCGVKNDLVLPDGKPTPKGEKDPSKPPPQQQQGR